jgi:hypothetical protein
MACHQPVVTKRYGTTEEQSTIKGLANPHHRYDGVNGKRGKEPTIFIVCFPHDDKYWRKLLKVK